jgi:pimeloyl-ACP methyl ester carboxylesterase
MWYVAKATQTRLPVQEQPRVRRGYFECRYGQLHVHTAIPPGGGFEEGTPLVCLHDFSGSGRVFTRFLSLAGRDRSVYAPDLPGFGESDAPAARPAIADYAAALADFLDSLRLRQVALLGLRMGTLPATELALNRTAQVTRVILVSVPLLTESERQAARNPSPLVPAADSAFRPPEWQRWAAEAAAHYPLRERLGRLSQRLLVLRPRDDLWEPTARVRDALPAARLIELEQPAAELFVSAPQRVAEAVREFLRA